MHAHTHAYERTNKSHTYNEDGKGQVAGARAVPAEAAPEENHACAHGLDRHCAQRRKACTRGL
eukprot:315475-Chlamydomonas_euryale.AAC.1